MNDKHRPLHENPLAGCQAALICCVLGLAFWSAFFAVIIWWFN